MRISLCIVIGFMLLAGPLGAASHYGFGSNGFEVSALSLALGGGPVAAVTYWQHNPLSAWGNPAFPSLHEGLSISGSNLEFMRLDQDSEKQVLERSAMLLGVSYKGIGIVLSAMDHAMDTELGKIYIYNADGYLDSISHPIERSNVYGLSLDLGDFTRNTWPKKEILPLKMDLALGITHVRNELDLDYNVAKGKGRSNNLGMLARVPLYEGSVCEWESALGVSRFNAFNQSKDCTSSSYSEQIYTRLNTSMELGLKIKSAPLPTPSPWELPYLATLRLVAGASEEYASDPLVWAMGAEASVAEMLFFRSGYHYDKAGCVDGFSYGLGLDLHYNDWGGIRFDYAEFPSHEGFKEKSMIEVGFYVNPF